MITDVETPEDLRRTTLYDRVGGRETFARILAAFFASVRDDPLLGPLYAADPEGAEQRLLMFLEEHWGGPRSYSTTRGAPMLRMRHMAYKVTPLTKDRWLHHMHAAISTVPLALEDEFLLRDHLERAGQYLINAED